MHCPLHLPSAVVHNWWAVPAAWHLSRSVTKALRVLRGLQIPAFLLRGPHCGKVQRGAGGGREAGLRPTVHTALPQGRAGQGRGAEGCRSPMPRFARSDAHFWGGLAGGGGIYTFNKCSRALRPGRCTPRQRFPGWHNTRHPQPPGGEVSFCCGRGDSVRGQRAARRKSGGEGGGGGQ